MGGTVNTCSVPVYRHCKESCTPTHLFQVQTERKNKSHTGVSFVVVVDDALGWWWPATAPADPADNNCGNEEHRDAGICVSVFASVRQGGIINDKSKEQKKKRKEHHLLYIGHL